MNPSPTELQLESIDVLEHLDRHDFVTRYARPGVPVVVKDAASGWRATQAWTYDYMIDRIGDQEVPLYRTGEFHADKPVNAPHTTMKFRDYADLVRGEGTDLRIFLLNPFRLEPHLLQDFSPPEIAGKTMGRFPMLFFASAEARVFLHYDIDMSHVFHTQFGGRKKVCLFSPDYSVPLYQVPMSVRSFMDLDVESPDYQRFPALRYARGYTATLDHGDTLYIPPGWWHQMRYVDNGFGLSQRSINQSVVQQTKAASNLFLVKPLEGGLRRVGGERWAEFKDRWSVRRANSYAMRQGSAMQKNGSPAA